MRNDVDLLRACGRERLVDAISQLSGTEINWPRKFLIRIKNLKAICFEQSLDSFEIMKQITKFRFRQL